MRLVALAGAATISLGGSVAALAIAVTHDDPERQIMTISTPGMGGDSCAVSVNDTGLPAMGIAAGRYNVVVTPDATSITVRIHRVNGAVVYESTQASTRAGSASTVQRYARLTPGEYHRTCETLGGVKATTNLRVVNP